MAQFHCSLLEWARIQEGEEKSEKVENKNSQPTNQTTNKNRDQCFSLISRLIHHLQMEEAVQLPSRAGTAARGRRRDDRKYRNRQEGRAWQDSTTRTGAVSIS